MKFDIKKLYKDSVKVLTDHQVEISTALAVIAIVAAESAEPIEMDAEEAEARNEISAMYREILDVTNKHLVTINAKLGVDDAA